MDKVAESTTPKTPKLSNKRILKGHFGKIYSTAWAPDSKKLVSASQDGKLIIWDALGSLKVKAITLKSSWVMTVAYSPSGKFVASGGLDNLCTVWSLEDTKSASSSTFSPSMAELNQHEGYLSSCKFVDDSTILTASGDAMCLLWDIPTAKATGVFNGHESDVMSIALNPEHPGIFISAACDEKAMVWDSREDGKREPKLTFEGHESDVNSVQWIGGYNAVTASDDSVVILWDIRSKGHLKKYSKREVVSGATCVSVSASGRGIFTTYESSPPCVFDTITGAREEVCNGHDQDRISTIAVSPDGACVSTASWDTFIKIWA